MPTAWWCNDEERYTEPEPVEEGASVVICRSCGEHYKCPECGFELDPAGNCQRFAVMGPEPDGTTCPAAKPAT